MKIVTITINNKPFQIACNEGEERRVEEAANAITQKLADLKTSSPSSSNDLLLVIVALSLQDKLTSLESNLNKTTDSNDDEKISETLSTMARYLETIAKKIAK